MKRATSYRSDVNNNQTMPLALSVHPNDGCLLTAPLSTVLHAATDSLYRDLHDMTYGSVTLAVPSSSTPTPTTTNVSRSVPDVTSKMKYSLHSGTMASLSFAQRRFQLASRLIHHARSISHVAALVSSHLPHSSGDCLPNPSTASAVTTLQPREGELSHIVTSLTNVALHQVQTSWIQADEAQDALYFQHADLYKHRKQVHDILGAMEVLLSGSWNYGMSWDVSLLSSKQVHGTSSKQEEVEEDGLDLRHRLQRAVQSKWILGEMGSMGTMSPWNISLEQDGCVLKLTHGSKCTPTNQEDDVIYPLVAYLTVLSEQAPNASLAYMEEEVEEEETDIVEPNKIKNNSVVKVAPWTLLSIQVNHRTKMGEPNYQLCPTNRQIYDLHRICVGNMAMEESRAWNLAQRKDKNTLREDIVARPLERLFHTMHTFSLSLHMEILCAQAEGLKKGTWADCILVEKQVWNSNNNNVPLVVVGEEDQESTLNTDKTTDTQVNPLLAVLAIHFWDVDDRYGTPTLGSFQIQQDRLDKHDLDKVASAYSPGTSPRRLTLQIQAIRGVGIRVSMSGGNHLVNSLQNADQTLSTSISSRVKKLVDQLLSSLIDPFSISMSDALLAATTLCAHNRCAAIVQALQRKGTSPSSNLPSWLQVHSVDSGCIAVAAELSYEGTSTSSPREAVILFHLTCDSRTGQFVTLFPRSFSLLRRLACNDSTASETQSLRQAVANRHYMNSSMVKRKSMGPGPDKDLTGRYVRDAFDSLNRSMDVLGKRVGVGGEWYDRDPNTSPALRIKYMNQACDDVRPCLMLCCALASSFGVACVAMGVSTGVDAMPDMGGGPIDRCSIMAPPLCVLLSQRLVGKEASEDSDRKYVLERNLFAVSTSFTDQSITTSFYDIVVEQTSLHSAQQRTKCSLRYLGGDDYVNENISIMNLEHFESFDDKRTPKRMRSEEPIEKETIPVSLSKEITTLSTMLVRTLFLS